MKINGRSKIQGGEGCLIRGVAAKFYFKPTEGHPPKMKSKAPRRQAIDMGECLTGGDRQREDIRERWIGERSYREV